MNAYHMFHALMIGALGIVSSLECNWSVLSACASSSHGVLKQKSEIDFIFDHAIEEKKQLAQLASYLNDSAMEKKLLADASRLQSKKRMLRLASYINGFSCQGEHFIGVTCTPFAHTVCNAGINEKSIFLAIEYKP